MNKKYILFLLLNLIITMSFSQGIVESPMTSNGVVISKYYELSQMPSYRTHDSTDTITLGPKGFLDDFSYEGPYPDTALWMDNYVFVNRDFPIAPITLGAATFDGVNEKGYPYDFTAAAGSTGKADKLTSKPIDLYFPGNDSVYFSFYYQAQGRGDWPYTIDSLILEFKNTVTGAWHHVWATKGLTSATTDSAWKYVSIHITDPGFLNKGFQFRFSNYATLSGTFDNWHIDYVYLNRNRTSTDSTNIIQDVSFVYNTPSMLNEYTVMPWKQYTLSAMRTNYPTTIRNNNNVVVFGGFGYNVYDEANVMQATYSAGAINYEPFSSVGYDTNPSTKNPPLNYSFPLLTARAKYRIESYLAASPDFILKNDTVKHLQEFHNYFSYDDGTAETSFGLAGFLHAQLAEKFTMSVPDTLRAVDIYFNPQLTNDNLFTFKLKVWNSTGSGSPGTAIFTSVDSLYRPIYNQTGQNKFVRYYLETPVYLTVGTFFVGFDQNTTQPINVGVDKNTNTQTKTFYNTSGVWQNPPNKGSLMMHPVLGSAADVVGIESKPIVSDSRFLIYPNPASDKLFIYSETRNTAESLHYTVIDIYGRTIANGSIKVSEAIDLSDVSNGVYFIRLLSGDNSATQKFIISR
jgi:hypothetical protein